MNLEKERIKAVCFDVDGTISDTDDVWVQKIERRLQPLRWMFRRRSHRVVARRLVMGIETPSNLLYHTLDRLDLDDEVAAIFSYLAKHDRRKHVYLLIPGVKEAIARLAEYYPLAVVSARDEKSTLAFLKHFDLLPYFQTVVTSQTCRYTKPFPDPVIRAAEEMGVSPQTCVMIGDTTVDIRAGKSAGAQTVGVLCGFGTENELTTAGADLILANTAQLAGALLDLTEF